MARQTKMRMYLLLTGLVRRETSVWPDSPQSPCAEQPARVSVPEAGAEPPVCALFSALLGEQTLGLMCGGVPEAQQASQFQENFVSRLIRRFCGMHYV